MISLRKPRPDRLDMLARKVALRPPGEPVSPASAAEQFLAERHGAQNLEVVDLPPFIHDNLQSERGRRVLRGMLDRLAEQLIARREAEAITAALRRLRPHRARDAASRWDEPRCQGICRITESR
jgi:hypothetical protein